MSQAIDQEEAEGVAERRAQKELTDRVAVRLERRSKSSNLKWSPRQWRFRGKA